MYIKGILWLLSWPVLIVVAYYIIRFALKKFESNLPDKED
jgi:hypothetical protein